MGDLPRSDLALERALESPKLTPIRRAEAHALRARNAKQRWQDAWGAAPTPEEKRTAALRSPYFEESWSEYLRGFEEDQNHFYSGLNALAMLTVMTELATAHSAIWMELFDDETRVRPTRRPETTSPAARRSRRVFPGSGATPVRAPRHA